MSDHDLWRIAHGGSPAALWEKVDIERQIRNDTFSFVLDLLSLRVSKTLKGLLNKSEFLKNE